MPATETADVGPKGNGPVLTDMQLPQIASRVFGVPLLVEQAKLDTIISVLSDRIGIESPSNVEKAQQTATLDIEARLVAAAGGTKIQRQDEGHYTAGHTAIIPVMGTLVQRGGWLSAMSGMTSYARVQAQLDAALADSSIDNIILEMDTPGGEVAGAFDFADYIYAQRGKKRMVAHANEMAASAGFLIASAADEVVVNRTGRVGSIGVVTAHVDRSKALDKAGLAVTYVYAGDHKIDGNPNQPLPADVKAALQTEIDSAYEMFVEAVARNTGLSAAKVRATQAAMFTGRKAVDAGLAKRVNTFANELQIAVSRSGASASRLSTSQQEKHHMADTQQKPTDEQLTAARAEGKAEGHAAGVAEGTKAGAAAERARIKAIVEHDEAKDRGALASHLAFDTDMAADGAIALLGKSGKDTVADPNAAKTALQIAMEKNGTPGLTIDVPNAPEAGKSAWTSTVQKFGGK